ncbi:MAG: CDP-glycerol--glycerophosphate glycerophosphotransferase [bacterium]|nr:CDP-glycerol--glycerophosphate glycerophosphotransferase [bacterium]
MNYLLFASQPNYFGVLRPLQEAIRRRGGRAAWFVTSGDLLPLLHDGETRLSSVAAVKAYDPLAVLVPGNWVPDFIPGIKVQVFHDMGFTKKGRFRIRGLFDLYCTCGPWVTAGFQGLAGAHPHFVVIETGWPKVDPLFLGSAESSEAPAPPCVLYAPTFSPSLTSAPHLLPEIRELASTGSYRWIVKFHDKMDRQWQRAYRELESATLRVEEQPNIVPLLQQADLLVSDTSSVISEFLLLDKPVVTFRNIDPGDYVHDIVEPGRLRETIDRALNDPGATAQSAADWLKKTHPYTDGHSSERVLQAVDTFIERYQGRLRAKPLNLWRKLKIRREMGYFRLN